MYKNVIMKPIIYNLLNAYDNKKLKSWKTKQKEEDFYKALESLSMKIKTLKWLEMIPALVKYMF